MCYIILHRKTQYIHNNIPNDHVYVAPTVQLNFNQPKNKNMPPANYCFREENAHVCYSITYWCEEKHYANIFLELKKCADL